MSIETLQQKDAWITAVAMYRKNRTSVKILEDLLFELQERIEKDVFDDEAWILKSAVQASLESITHYHKGDYFR